MMIYMMTINMITIAIKAPASNAHNQGMIMTIKIMTMTNMMNIAMITMMIIKSPANNAHYHSVLAPCRLSNCPEIIVMIILMMMMLMITIIRVITMAVMMNLIYFVTDAGS